MTDENPRTIEEATAEIMASNGARLQRLAMKDIGIDMMTLTLRHLIETLYPTEAERAEMNLAFQNRLAVEITMLEENADRIVLERSAQQAQTSPLIVPGGAQR